MDILSLIPLDLLYLVFGTKAVFLRAPRLLKIQSFWEFFKLLDRVISSPHMVSIRRFIIIRKGGQRKGITINVLLTLSL